MALPSLHHRLDEAREALFVGRADELTRIGSLLATDDARFLYVDAPAGMGKTELLRAAARYAVRSGYHVTWIDGHSRLWSETELAEELRAGVNGPHLIVLDAFESLLGVQDALRERLLPQISDRARVIGAGRVRLAAAWNVDPGWLRHTRMVHLGPLSLHDATSYLVRRGIGRRAKALAEQSSGVPLALALIADAASRPDNDNHADTLELTTDGGARAIEWRDHVTRTPADAVCAMLQVLLGLASPRPAKLLDRRAFEEAVRGALRLCHRADLLTTSPLCDWLGIGVHRDSLERGRQLVALLRRESERLFSSTKDHEIGRVLVHTYFEPLGKQEAIADELRLPFGSYRRHLTAGTRRLVDYLWARYGA
jgi:hypothetical protein